MPAKLNWEALLREGLVHVGKVAARASMIGLHAASESAAHDVEKVVKKAEQKTRKVRDAIKKAMREIGEELGEDE